MAVTLIDTKIYDRLRPNSFVNWPLFAVGDYLLFSLDYQVFTNITVTVAAPLVTGAGNQQLFNASGKFASFSVGDTIKISGPSGFFNTNTEFPILQKFNNNTIQVGLSNLGNPLPSSASYSDVTLNNLTIIKDIKYEFNFIENSEAINFNSKIDGSPQVLRASGVDASFSGSPVPLVAQGNPEWQFGTNLGITNNICYKLSHDTSNGRQIFRIIHKFIVNPIFLAAQYTNFQQGIAPSYFLNNACLTYVSRFNGMVNFLNPNIIQSSDLLPQLGNSGWGNEVFNLGPQAFQITNVVFKYGAATIPKLQLVVDPYQTINFDIESIGQFAPGMRVEMGIIKCPNNQSEYQNNSRYLDENFLITMASGAINAGPLIPFGFSTTNFLVSSWEVTYINANKLSVVANVLIGAGALAILQESPIPRFLFWATVSNPALTLASEQNKQVCWDKIHDFEIIKTPSNIDITQTFKRHYEDAGDVGISGKITTFKNDECVMESLISGDFAEFPEFNQSNLTKIIQQIVAVRSDGNEFIIEDWELPFTAIWQQGNPFMNFTTNRIFRIPQTEIRKPITIETVNIGGDWKYLVRYPFMIRWENWLQLIGASNDFFNPLQQQNGQNQDWEHYQNANWQIYFRSGVEGLSEGGSFSFQKDILIEINNYATNPDYSIKKIETFNLAGTQLLAGGTNFIQSFAPTVVVATFAKPTGLLVANSRVVFGLEIHEQGGINGRVRYSSVWETDTPLTWFIPFSGSIHKVLISQSGGTTVEAKGVIDHNLLPIGNFIYSIVARIYEVPAPIDPEGFKKMEDGTYKLMEDGTQKIIE